MSDWYELIGQTPVRMEGDILECGLRFETMDRRVAFTMLFGMCQVSTVFLGIDHGFGKGPPILFETMAFWRGEGGYEQERCSTWMDAQRQHAMMCEQVSRPGAVATYVQRTFREWWCRAKTDLGQRWREMRGVELTEMEKTFALMENRIFDRQEEW